MKLGSLQVCLCFRDSAAEQRESVTKWSPLKVRFCDSNEDPPCAKQDSVRRGKHNYSRVRNEELLAKNHLPRRAQICQVRGNWSTTWIRLHFLEIGVHKNPKIELLCLSAIAAYQETKSFRVNARCHWVSQYQQIPKKYGERTESLGNP